MLSSTQIDELAVRIVSGHQEAMIVRLIEQLVRALASDGTLSVQDMRLLDSVANMNRDAVNGILLEHGGKIRAETKTLVTEALKISDDGDTEILLALYPGVASAGYSAVFARIAQETAQGLSLIIARDNVKMASYAQQTWYDVAGEAITRWNHGSDTPDHIIGDAVTRLTREGFTTIDYKSGIRSQIDVAVRRHIVSQVGQAAGRMTEKRLAQYGHDLVQTSAHFGARPSHAAWQGRVFSLSGTTPGYPDFVAATGYGSVTGLLGANCGHSFGPYFPGITELPALPERVNGMTNDELYDATQKQRGYERAIRQTKRDIHALKTAGVDDTAARLKLGNRQRKAKAWADGQGLPRRPKLEKAYGVGDERPRALRVAR